MGLWDYLSIVRRQWQLVLSVAALVMLVTSAYVVLAPRAYVSTTRLFVTAAPTQGSSLDQVGEFSQARVVSYAALLSSREFADQLETHGGALSDVGGRISASADPDTVMLTVKVRGNSPKQAKDISEQMLPLFLRRLTGLEAGTPVRLRVVGGPTLPSAPTSPQPLRDLTRALLGGLMLGVAVVLVRELLSTRVRSSADVELAAGHELPSLGRIRRDADSVVGNAILDPGWWRRPIAEDFRTVRSNLGFVAPGVERPVIGITSAGPGEGKTTLAIGLASALALSGRRVLLIDADMRRGCVGTRLGLEEEVGLSSVLVAEVNLVDAVQVATPQLSVLTRGNRPPNPAELLVSAEFEKLIDEARQTFDVVIVDAAPCLPVVDGLLVGAVVDATVIAVRYRSTTLTQLARTIDGLDGVRARTVGHVLTLAQPPARRERSSYAAYVEAPAPPRPRRVR